jgi:multidrug efflux pump subunit AcrA (membrane-fusion protein)
VPVDSIFVTKDGPVVWRKTPTGFEARRVDVGQRNRDLVEVRAGLAAGDRVSRVDLGREPSRGAGGAS